MRIVRVLWSLYLIALGLAVVSLSLWSIYSGYVYDLERDLGRAVNDLGQLFDIVRNPGWFFACYAHQQFLQGVTNLLLVACAIVIVFRKRIWNWGFTKRENRIASNFFKDVADTYPRVRWIAVFGLTCVSLLLLLLIRGCLAVALDCSRENLAHLVDGLGFYEFGEHIYSFSRSPSGNTLASTCGRIGHDSDRSDLKKLNQTVAQIYGSRSLEMARRYTICAGHCQFNFEDYSTSSEYYQKAAEIYEQIGRTSECAEVLSFDAFAQAELNHFSAAHQRIDRALRLLDRTNASVGEKNFVLGELEAAAWDIKDEGLVADLKQRLSSPKSKSQSDNASLDIVVVLAIGVPFILMALVILKKACLRALGRRWMREFELTPDSNSRSRCLNKLIHLELYKGNWKQADEYSQRLLQLWGV